MSVEALLLDVDETLIHPCAVFDDAGYRTLGARLGATLDGASYEEACAVAFAAVFGPAAPLDHDPASHRRVAVEIAREMGAGDAAEAIGVLADEAWSDPANFALFDDVRPTLDVVARHGVTIGVVSNTHRELAAFLRPFELPLDFVLSSREHGRHKPCPTIFAAALARAGVGAERAAMVGDSLHADVEGAGACGVRAVLLDRSGRHGGHGGERISSLAELPALLGFGEL